MAAFEARKVKVAVEGGRWVAWFEVRHHGSDAWMPGQAMLTLADAADAAAAVEAASKALRVRKEDVEIEWPKPAPGLDPEH